MRRVLLGIALLSGLLLLGAAETMAADRPVEMVRPRGLLLTGPVAQSVGLRYEYYGRDAEETTSSTHRFKEKYSLETIAGIWDPDLLNLDMKVDLWFEQLKDNNDAGRSQDSDTFDINYSLAASAFQHEYYPVVVYSSREESNVSYSLSPSYRMTVTRNSVVAKYRSTVLPFRLYYQHLTSDSSGRTRDSSTISDILNLTVTNDYRGISFTQLDVSFNEQEQEIEQTGTTDSNVAVISLSNSLYLDKMKKYSLGSQFQRQESSIAGDPQKFFDLTEALRARFGRALNGEAIYQYTSDEMQGFDGLDQELTANQFTLNLNHMLFESLQTRLDGHIRESQLNGGDESQTGIGLWFNYRKRLPKVSLLQVNVGGANQETSRDLEVSKIRVKKQFSNVKRNEPIELDLTGGTLIAVESVVGKADGESDRIFNEGVNYDVDLVFSRIIPTGSDFPDPVLDTDIPGLTVEVTYTIGFDRPSIDYVTDIRSISSTLSLLDGRYNLLASYYQEDQSVESGQIASGGLSDTKEVEVRFETRINYHRFGFEYGSHEAGSNRYSYLEGDWFYDRSYPLGNLRLQARNRYTNFDAVRADSSDYDVNTLTMGGSYARRVFSWVQLVCSLNYANVSGNASRDAIYFRTALQGTINQLHFNVNGTSLLRMEEDRTTRDDFFNFEITRYF